MKFAIALCLLLAIGCNANESTHDINFTPFIKLQERMMKSLMSTQSVDDSNVITECFNHYMVDQKGVLDHYNQMYSGCVVTSQEAKSELTAQSNEQRTDLLARSDTMCSSLSSCDRLTDGMEFFDCYRNASADSYKVMFTLNSDANVQFNTISSKYAIIDTNLKSCVDEARLEYAHELETCDNEFNDCISGKPKPQPDEEKPEDKNLEQIEALKSHKKPSSSHKKPHKGSKFWHGVWSQAGSSIISYL